MNQMEETVRNILRSSGNVVVISGENVMREAGLNGIHAEHIAYDIESKYGYSYEEIVTSSFLSRRVDKFYEYYRNVILNVDNPQPTAVHRGILRLQNYGKLDAVVTDMVYGLHRKAGCNKVIEICGSVEENKCPVCGRVYGSDYIKHTNGVPECEHCKVPLRPGFSLYGEMIDNGKMTQATNAVANARYLIIIGTSVRSNLCVNLQKYFKGEKNILINDRERPGDEIIQYRLYGNISSIFQNVMDF